MKITVDRDACIGCGACTDTAPHTFELDDQGLAVVLDEKGDPDPVIKEAAEGCPVDAIILKDETGKQIYP